MSQRDIKVLVPAGGSVVVSAPGEFIYLKDCARPLTIRVNGQAINMERGEKRREPGRFDQFTVDNSSATLPTAAVFVVGLGDYEKLIVSGELYAMPGVIGADGLRRPDRRYWRDAVLNFEDTSAAQFAQGVLVASGDSATPLNNFSLTQRGFIVGDVLNVPLNNNYDNDPIVLQYDKRSGIYLGRTTVAGVFGVPEPSPSGTSKRYNAFSQDIATGDVYGVWETLSGGERRGTVYRMSRGGSAWEHLALAPVKVSGQRIQGVVRDPVSGRFIVSMINVTGSGHNVRIFDDTWTLLHTLGQTTNRQLSNSAIIRAALYRERAGAGDWVIVSGGSGNDVRAYNRADFVNGILTDETATAFANTGSKVDLGSGLVAEDTDSRALYSAVVNVANGVRARRWAAEDYTLSGRLYITNNRTRIVEPLAVDVYADIVHTVEGGQRYAQGEVIRALVWGLLGREPGTDYMDHVYQVELYPGADGAPQTVLTGGVESLQAAGFADNYKLQLPTVAKLQIDI